MNHIFKSIIVILALAAGTMAANCEHITPQRASQMATQLKTSLRSQANTDIKKSSDHAQGSSFSPTLVYEGHGNSAGTPAFYVFNYPEDEGFVIISSDDEVAPVLGYSDTGRFDGSDIPANMKVWLDGYAAEIASYLSLSPENRESRRASSRTVASEHESVEPLLTTKWNQDAPFNDLCPIINGTKAPTGCTATALAQVMNYHKWPRDYGKGSRSYTRNGYTMSMDFSQTKFDWENMADIYTQSSTDSQNKAVATLMKACGVATDMFYDASSSGAYMFYIPEALAQYFGYAPGARYVQRDAYDYMAWEELIYNELADGRPVQYEGYSSQGGHSFVVDGYAGNHFFHLNWGWGGSSDGYFLLSALNPADQGIGSAEGGYNTDQAAIIGLRPDTGTGGEDFVNVYNEGGLALTSRPALKLRDYTVHNNINTHQVEFSVKLVSVGNPTDERVLQSPLTLEMGGYVLGKEEALYGDNQVMENAILSIDKNELASIPSGEYRLYPVYRSLSMDWTSIPILSGPQYLTVALDGTGGIRDLGSQSAETRLCALPFEDSRLFVWKDGTSGPVLPIAVTNQSSSDFYGEIKVSFIQSEAGSATASGTVTAIIPAGQTATIGYGGPGLFPKTDGEYNVRIETASGDLIGEIPLSVSTVETPGVMAYYFEIPGHIYEKTDFRRQKLAIWYYNRASSTSEIKPELRIVGAGDLSTALRVTSGTKRSLAADEVKRLEYGSWNVGSGNDYLPAGEYYLQVFDALTQAPLSLPQPLKIWKEADDIAGLFVGVNTRHEVYVVAPSTSPSIAGRPETAVYEGVLDIPATVTVNGEVCPVTYIAHDALSMAQLEGVVVESPSMDIGHLAAALSRINRNNSALYLMPGNYEIQKEKAAEYGLESYVLATDYRIEILEGDRNAVTPDRPLICRLICEAAANPAQEWDRHFTVSPSGDGITATTTDDDKAEIIINVKSVSDKGKVTVTPRQPHASPIEIAINGGDDTGVAAPGMPYVNLTGCDGVITVSGVTPGTQVTIVSLEGIILGSRMADPDGCCEIHVQQKGALIVRIGNQSFKLFI